MGGVDAPFPPGDYDVVVIGSGPGGLQTSYVLRRLGVRHAVLSRDDAPGGMFRRFPIFQRLITWTKPEAPVARDSRDYEWYDHNSLVAEEPELRALVPTFMDRSFDLPARDEMEQGLVAFAERAQISVRYGCTWTATSHEGERIVLETTDGAYTCRAAVFAIGVTEPWRAAVPGIDAAAHYAETTAPERYDGRRVFIVGKRNSAFELAHGLLPWARQTILASPRPVDVSTLATSPLRLRYLHPYEEYRRGGPGTYVLDAVIERIERRGDAFRVETRGTEWDGALVFEVDDVIAATGFQAPLNDLPRLGLATVADGRVPALTPFWESVSLPRVYFTGNASQGAPGVGTHGAGANSGSVNGFRYNARCLAQHLAETHFGVRLRRRRVAPEAVVEYLLDEVTRAPELWVQKGYLCRVLTAAEDGGFRDDGILPLAVFLDGNGASAVAVTVEVDAGGAVAPRLYVRAGGEIAEHELSFHPVHAYNGEPYARLVADALRGLGA